MNSAMRNGKNQNGFSEAARYYRNARELLSRCKIEDDIYVDIKPVREAFGTAWLAVEMALRAALVQRGLQVKQVPRNWEALSAAAHKHLAVHNGRLTRLIRTAYEVVHIGGYYYGDMRTAPLAKGAMDIARRVIETLAGRKM